MHQHTKKYMYITLAVEKNLKNCYLDVFVKEITRLFNIPSKYVLNEFSPGCIIWLLLIATHQDVLFGCPTALNCV